MRLTERGFIVFGEVTDTQGNVIRVQESSAMGEERWCRLFAHDHDFPDAIAHPHLTRVQAREVARALLHFANGTDEALEALRADLEQKRREGGG